MFDDLDADVDFGERGDFVGCEHLLAKVEIEKDKVRIIRKIRDNDVIVIVQELVPIESVPFLGSIFVVGLVDGSLKQLEGNLIDAIPFLFKLSDIGLAGSPGIVVEVIGQVSQCEDDNCKC